MSLVGTIPIRSAMREPRHEPFRPLGIQQEKKSKIMLELFAYPIYHPHWLPPQLEHVALDMYCDARPGDNYRSSGSLGRGAEVLS